MTLFVLFAVVLIIFEDFEHECCLNFDLSYRVHQVIIAVIVMSVLAVMLNRYARRMDERISREQAEKENRMRRELTHNIGHELKTPVASILGYAETLRDNPDLDPAVRQQFVERTLAQTTRLASLLQDLSTLNRIDYAPDQITMEPVDVSELFSSIVSEMALTLAANKVTLANMLPEKLVVTGNASLLHSIWRNLMENAVTYGGLGVTIHISARHDADGWHFVFSDNGPGVPEEHLPRLFERFYRLDNGRSRSHGGTGLGLSIVKNAVLLHRGTIAVSIVQPKGLRFDFNIPD